jgi:hypothetical protein
MDRRTAEAYLTWFPVVAAVVHFTGGTVYHVQFGQFLPMLIVDDIAVGLRVVSVAAFALSLFLTNPRR